MISSNLSAIFYLVSGILFILALRGLSSPDTSRQGNYFGIAGMIIAIVVTLVGALRAFDLIAVMTAGGPWGSSEVLAYKMYQEALFNYRMGYGAAIATILFLIMDIYIAWFLYRLFKNERSEK